jgi:hypothetical protein
MKRDVMLPKFNLPGQTSWLMKGLWIAGGVVLVQVAVVTTLLLRHRVGRSETAVMPVAAPVAPARVVDPPARLAEPPSDAVEAAAPRGPAARQTPPSDPPRMKRGFGNGKPGFARFRGKGRRNGERVFARTSLGARKAALGPKAGRKAGPRNEARNEARNNNAGARPGARPGKPDAIDQILRNFK